MTMYLIHRTGSNPVLTTKLNIMSRTIKLKRKTVAKSCRNHGGCPVCEGNRLYNSNKKMQATNYSLNNLKTNKI